MPSAAPARSSEPQARVLRYERHRPDRRCSTGSLRSTTRHSSSIWPVGAGRCRSTCRSEFESYLKCGQLEHGFLRVRCDTCHAEHLVAFSCKRRGICPSCGARRMAETAALLVDDVLPEQPLRQWVLSVPYALRFVFASQPAIMGRVLAIVYRVISTHLINKAGAPRRCAHRPGSCVGHRAAAGLGVPDIGPRAVRCVAPVR